MKQKLLLLLALLGMAMSPLLADTQDEFSGNCGRKVQYNTDSANLQWRMDTAQHKLIITGSGQMMDYSTDTKAPWYPWRSYIQTVTFPDGMTTVGAYAFYYCDHLQSPTFPESLTSINSYAFYYCHSLTKVKLGNHVQYINSYAFSNCRRIKEVDFGESPTTISSYAFNTADSLVTFKAKKIRSIGSRAFQGCSYLVNLQLGDSINTISDRAFGGCNRLKAVHFPATLKSLHYYSFQYSYNLETITVDPANTVYDSRNNCNAVIQTSNNTLIMGCRTTVIPSNVSTIGESAFFECDRLQSITFPAGLQQIQTSAFNGCDSLTSLVLPEGLQSLGTQAFANCSRLQTVYLPNSVTSIECEVFQNCYALTAPIYNTTYFVQLPTSYQGAYTIPGTPIKIACGAFENCKNLTSVTIPVSVTNIYNNAFKNCIRIETAPLPNGLTYLGQEVFNGCSKLASIIIPERIKAIYDRTFSSCSSLPSIHIPDSVTSIGRYAFSSCSMLTEISFPANLTSFGGNILSGCNNLNTIHWNVRQYNSFSVNTSSDPFNNVRNQITSVSFGDSVRIIPANLCYGMDKLTSLAFGSGIQTIGENAFEGCLNIKSINWNVRAYVDPEIYTQAPFYPLRDSITEFTFGDSVQHIPAYLCHSMSRLHQLYIPERVSSIGQFAFRYLGTMDSIDVHEDNMFYDSRNHCNALIETSSDILLLGCYKTQIPYDITGIGDCAFRNVRNLTAIELPENVSFVGKEAFNGCHDMKTLNLPENLATIDDYAFQDCDSLTHVTLPSHLATVGFRAFAHCSGLEEVNSPAPTPPVIDETSFSGTTCPIRVPCAYIADYRSAPVWMDFGNRLAGEALYTLTVQPNEYAYGVAKILQKPDCEHEAIVEATPSRGYVFKSWQKEDGTVLSSNAYYSFTLEEDLNLIAVFGRITEGFENVEEGNDAAIWYDIMGHRVSQPSSGVYIVVTGNETYKVLIP